MARRQLADSAVAVVLHIALLVTLAIVVPWLMLLLVVAPMTIACGSPGTTSLRPHQVWKFLRLWDATQDRRTS